MLDYNSQTPLRSVSKRAEGEGAPLASSPNLLQPLGLQTEPEEGKDQRKSGRKILSPSPSTSSTARPRSKRADLAWPPPRERLVERQSLLALHHALLLHAPVLEPDFDLLVAEVQPVGQFLTLLPIDEFIDQEFVLQLRNLLLCIRFPLLAGPPRGRPPRQA